MTKATILDFLRHGEVSGGHYFRGVTDDPLTERGWGQMYRQCGEGRWDVVVSSPLRRCSSFASAWTERHQGALLIDADWAEIDFGDWEGRTADQIAARQPAALEAYYADPLSFTPPNAESYARFAKRIASGIDRICGEYSGRSVLIVTHAGVIRAVFSNLLAIAPPQSFQIDVPHGCMSRFSCFQNGDNRFAQLNFHRPI